MTTKRTEKSLTAIDYDALPQGLSDLLRPKVERLGYLGDFFRHMAHAPAPLEAFIRFTETTLAQVPKSLAEVIALSIATETENAYERTQHERLSIALGFSAEWVGAVCLLSPDDAPGLTSEERLVQKLALDAVRTHGRTAQAHVAAANQIFDPEILASLLFLIGRYTAHAAISNLLGLKAPVASIFEDET